jgi:hypothetical protein
MASLPASLAICFCGTQCHRTLFLARTGNHRGTHTEAENEVVKDNIIQKLEIEKEQLAEINHMQSEEITTLTSQLEKSRKMLTKEIADSNEIMIACHNRIKEESAL